MVNGYYSPPSAHSLVLGFFPRLFRCVGPVKTGLGFRCCLRICLISIFSSLFYYLLSAVVEVVLPHPCFSDKTGWKFSYLLSYWMADCLGQLSLVVLGLQEFGLILVHMFQVVLNYVYEHE